MPRHVVRHRCRRHVLIIRIYHFTNKKHVVTSHSCWKTKQMSTTSRKQGLVVSLAHPTPPTSSVCRLCHFMSFYSRLCSQQTLTATSVRGLCHLNVTIRPHWAFAETDPVVILGITFSCLLADQFSSLRRATVASAACGCNEGKMKILQNGIVNKKW